MRCPRCGCRLTNRCPGCGRDLSDAAPDSCPACGLAMRLSLVPERPEVRLQAWTTFTVIAGISAGVGVALGLKMITFAFAPEGLPHRSAVGWHIGSIAIAIAATLWWPRFVKLPRKVQWAAAMVVAAGTVLASTALMISS